MPFDSEGNPIVADSHVYFTGESRIHTIVSEEEETFYAASRDKFVNLVSKDVRDPLWFMAVEEWTGWMEDEEEEFFVSRETSLSFPIPKLGVKTRPCSGVITAQPLDTNRGGIMVGRGTVTVYEGDTSVTIAHGYNGPGVLMLATPSWDTGIKYANPNNTTTTLSFTIEVPAGGGTLVWVAFI